MSELYGPFGRARAGGGPEPWWLAEVTVGRHTDVEVRLLGDFEVHRDGVAATSAGIAGQAVRLVALRGELVHVDDLVHALWQDADDDQGRQRLRNVLSRLREAIDPEPYDEERYVRAARTLAVDGRRGLAAHSSTSRSSCSTVSTSPRDRRS